MGLTRPSNHYPDQHGADKAILTGKQLNRKVGHMVGVQELLVECLHGLLSQGGCQQKQLVLRKPAKLDP